MSLSDTVILLDDNSTALYYGNGWIEYPEPADVGASTAWSRDSNTTSVALTFQGTSASFIGNTPHDWTNLTVVIDNGTPIHKSAPNALQFYRAWYTTPQLTDDLHTVNISGFNQIALDYVTVTAGQSTVLTGTKLVVDDNSGDIAYTGRWQQLQKTYALHPGGVVISSYANTTHSSNTVGDIMTFPFAGTSVSVYGIVQWGLVGNVTTTYTIDNTLQGTTALTSFGVDPTNGYQDQVNYLFFQSPILSTGNHVLEINVTAATGAQPFVFDYLTYQPSFSSLSTKPDLSGAGSTPPSSSSSAPLPTSSSDGANIPVHKSHSNAGAIAGGVVGGILGVLLVLFGLFFFLRRRRQAARAEPTVVASPAVPPAPVAEVPQDWRRPHVQPFDISISPSVHRSDKSYGLRSPDQDLPTSTYQPSITTSPTTIAERQTELRRQMQELQALVTQLAPNSSTDLTATSSAVSDDSRVSQLQRQIDILMQENARLQARQELESPPPYGHRHD